MVALHALIRMQGSMVLMVRRIIGEGYVCLTDKTVRLVCVWLYLIVIAPCYNISVTLGSLPYCDRASRVPVNTKEFYYE